MLCERNEKNLSVIAVVGIEWEVWARQLLLDRVVYNSDEVMNFFQKKVWVTVLDDFDACHGVLNKMVQSLTKKVVHYSNVEAVIRKLQESVKGETLLLVCT